MILNKLGIIALCLFSQCAIAQTEQDQLKDVQQEIKRSQAQVQKQLADAKQIQARLKQDELAIAKTAKALNQTRQALAQTQQRQAELLDEQKQLVGEKQQQEALLAKQVRAAYMTGKHDYLKLLFNQEDAGKFERINSYYRFLNQARIDQIRRFGQLIADLERVEAELMHKAQQLKELQWDQQQQSEQLNSQQAERQQTLVALNQSIQSDSARIETLQINEQALLKAIQEAQRRAQQSEKIAANLQGLAQLKGQLSKPADGRIRQLYGARRQGQVRWKGILIEGDIGNSVAAVHQGTVLYADWLKGFGLVTAIDHGQGYMSLYGHNQALLKQVGDTVEAGETIALVGQSGGQATPGLYFEIRHKGKAINPKGWFNRP